MPTPTTIDAALVAAGIGLPSMARYLCHQCKGDDCGWTRNDDGSARDPLCLRCDPRHPDAGTSLDPSDHQTRCGVLQRLAMWAGDSGQQQAYWLEYDAELGEALWSSELGRDEPIRHFAVSPERASNGDHAVLIAIVEDIGRDHRIRRRLGWPVTPGTLADLEFIGGAWHMFPEDGGDGDYPPAVFGNQEAVEAYVEGQCKLVPDIGRALDTAAALYLIDAQLEAAKGAK